MTTKSKSVKLTNDLRAKLTASLVKAHMAPRYAEFDALVKAKMPAIVECLVSEEVIAELKALSSEARAKISVVWSEKIDLGIEHPAISEDMKDISYSRVNARMYQIGRAIPQHPHYCCSFVTAGYLREGYDKQRNAIVAEIHSLAKEVASERDKMREQISATLASFSTIKALREALPEIDPHLPEQLKNPPASGVLVPVADIERVRKVLAGLPAKTATVSEAA